uniref:Dioxygenase n=1 Tax=Oscillatoriales cyanobacterium SpSt-402 TaxID=2282168 RepID=A0A832M3J7_9CYAN
MVNTLQPIQAPAWTNAVKTPAQEFGPVSLKVLSGKIPSGLRGSLYRNGPAQLERNGHPVGHWFDGDGGILGVHFNEESAIGLYRYIQTAGFQIEEKANQYILAGYGMLPPVPLWQRFDKDVKNVANTSVLALPNKLLALWEGGLPHALDLKTLETIGLDDLGGLNGRSFSAHPKRDPKTGEIYNFGVVIGQQTTLQLYRSSPNGNLRQENSVPLSGVPLIHDCAIAGRYLIFCIPPVRIQILPVLARLKSFSDAMAWQPTQGTEMLVVDRDTLEVVSRITTDPWYQWHFGNGYELPDGSIVFHLARYPDFQTNQRLKEIATGQMQTFAKATLWQLRLDPQAGKVLETQELLSQSCEFPVVNPQEVGQPSRYTYLSVHQPTTTIQTEVYDTIARFDHQTGTLTQATLGDRCYPNEPIYAPDATEPQRGWVLTVLYNSVQHRSELWIFDAAHLDTEPICQLELPAIVPLGFHGTWHPN